MKCNRCKKDKSAVYKGDDLNWSCLECLTPEEYKNGKGVLGRETRRKKSA